VKRIGHFGFFKEQFAGTLWREALAWLKAAVEERENNAVGADYAGSVRA